ncbi:MAG TPA: diaminobutyrate acetyltransferase [Kofleriaceae bacterium]|nr:diaminobutyrate acetyltransferase [Kofleriaceae bacterium]
MLRSPRAGDAPAVWQLIGDAGTLERNTAYAYVLLCTHFAETCVVAEQGDQLVGVVCAYRPPGRDDTLFVWQVGVHPSMRGRGLGRRLLDAAVTRAGARFLEATVAPSNEASRRLFGGFARVRGATCEIRPGFAGELFAAGHEDEDLFHIGPLEN